MQLMKDDEDDGNLDTALDVLAKQIKRECSSMEYDGSSYHTDISKELSQEKAIDTLKRLLHKMSLDELSLPSIHINNIITSVKTKRPTPLQIALGIYFRLVLVVTATGEFKTIECCNSSDQLQLPCYWHGWIDSVYM